MPTSVSVPIVMGQRADPAIACTLPAGQLPERIDQWRRLLDHVTAREDIPAGETGLRLTLANDAPLDELARLAMAEQGCCSFFSFAITVDGRGLALEVRAPVGATDVVDALFGRETGSRS